MTPRSHTLVQRIDTPAMMGSFLHQDVNGGIDLASPVGSLMQYLANKEKLSGRNRRKAPVTSSLSNGLDGVVVAVDEEGVESPECEATERDDPSLSLSRTPSSGSDTAVESTTDPIHLTNHSRPISKAKGKRRCDVDDEEDDGAEEEDSGAPNRQACQKRRLNVWATEYVSQTVSLGADV